MLNNNTVVDGTLNILNKFNRHFVKVSEIIDKTSFSQGNFAALENILDEKLGTEVFDIAYITPFEVSKIIEKLDSGKASGLDGIGPKILKHCGDIITPRIVVTMSNRLVAKRKPPTCS